jgi:hypothetical protein
VAMSPDHVVHYIRVRVPLMYGPRTQRQWSRFRTIVAAQVKVYWLLASLKCNLRASKGGYALLSEKNLLEVDMHDDICNA